MFCRTPALDQFFDTIIIIIIGLLFLNPNHVKESPTGSLNKDCLMESTNFGSCALRPFSFSFYHQVP